MSEVTLGGERLGGGKKNKVHLRNYERSTHDQSFVWRSTMGSGTLVPFWTEVALPGDTFDLDLDVNVLTHPTIGPLFGTYKVHLDVFQIPIRLYQGQLHQNKLGIGMKMANVKLPQVQIVQNGVDITKTLDEQGINPSCLLAYLGIRGNGWNALNQFADSIRRYNAVPLLGYWDIYKNYYANKQEEIGAAIHQDMVMSPISLEAAQITNSIPEVIVPVNTAPDPATPAVTRMTKSSVLNITGAEIVSSMAPNRFQFWLDPVAHPDMPSFLYGTQLFKTWDITTGTIYATNPVITTKEIHILFVSYYSDWVDYTYATEPQVVTFPLKNIDTVRTAILKCDPANEPFVLDVSTGAPYDYPMEVNTSGDKVYAYQFNQEGLGLRTYASDLFNNWISTEWIDGPDGISAITAVDTTAGSFTIDELNLAKKVYDMLNRISISGGSYDDWLDAVYTHERTRTAESPIYLGGLIKNIVFQEVISQSKTADQPLGTLAGRGTMGHLHKGGKIVARVDEPSYLMGIVSIVPNIDYSQGNKWDLNLKTMDDFHKPALDEIGFQDLITDQMAWWDTTIDTTNTPIFKSAGKQPAWINYMTNVNVVRGNFALQNQQMYMTLNRRYEANYEASPTIADLTTYIDPKKFNHIFADTRLDAQNFWTQIGVNLTSRRKMSAKVMPNL